MAQNTSSAVMQQRHEPRDSLEDFPTAPWATRAACEWLERRSTRLLKAENCREPAANRGFMVRPLREYFGKVIASDVHDYGAGFDVQDYLFMHREEIVDWTFCNPPFRLAEAFIHRALISSRVGVAMFVRASFLEGTKRHAGLFKDRPPTDILQFCERVVLHKGRLPDPDVAEEVIDPETGRPKINEKTGKVEMRKPSSATSYCWLIWNFDTTDGQTRFHWIPPCRKQLTKPGDYDVP